MGRHLASLDPRLRLETRHFDYRHPDFSNMKIPRGHVIVFSTHSIEQVSAVPGDLLDKLCALAPEVTGVHFEPIGWQFDGEPSSAFAVAHQKRCLEKNYNTNFWGLLKRCESRGMIKIVEAVPYFFGLAYNPPCNVMWNKITDAPHR